MWALNSKRLRNLFASAVYFALDSLILMVAVVLRPRSRSGGMCVLKLGGVGDFILWQSCIEMYVALGDGKPLTLVVSKECVDFARIIKSVDDVISVDAGKFYKNFWYRLMFALDLRRIKYSLFIHPTTSRKFPLTESISRFARADLKVAASSDVANIESVYKYISNRFYDKIIPVSAGLGGEIENNILFCANILGISYKEALGRLRKIDVEGRSDEISGKYFLVIPGASWEKRKWPIACFSSVSGRIQRETGLIPVICGTASDVLDGARIAGESGDRAVNLCGKTGALRLLSLIRHAEFVIGNESAGVHIAAFVGTKSIAILGGGHYGRFLPYPSLPAASGIVSPVTVHIEMDCFGCNWQCKFRTEKSAPVPCIADIGEGAVYDAWREFGSALEGR